MSFPKAQCSNSEHFGATKLAQDISAQQNQHKTFWHRPKLVQKKMNYIWGAKCAKIFALRFFALNKAIFDYLINSQFKCTVFDYLINSQI